MGPAASPRGLLGISGVQQLEVSLRSVRPAIVGACDYCLSQPACAVAGAMTPELEAALYRVLEAARRAVKLPAISWRNLDALEAAVDALDTLQGSIAAQAHDWGRDASG